MASIAYLVLALGVGAAPPHPSDLTAVLPGRSPSSRPSAVAWSKAKGCFISGSYVVDTDEELMVAAYCKAVRILMVVPWAQWRRQPQAILERVQAQLHSSGFDDLEVLPLQALKDGAAATSGGVTLAWMGAGLVVQTEGVKGTLPRIDLPEPSWRPTGVAFAPSPDRRRLFVQFAILEEDSVDANLSQIAYRYQDARGWRASEE